MQDLARMGVFVVVAEELNLSAAAKKLGISKSAVSKQISALEKELDLKLFDRDTRRTRLTSEGEAIFENCKDILSKYKNTRDLAQQLQSTPSGSLTLEICDNLAQHFVLPYIGQFKQQYPLIKLNIEPLKPTLKESCENLDVAVIPDQPLPSSITARKLIELDLSLYASHQYLEQAGTPQGLDDLADHTFIQINHVSQDCSLHFIVDGKARTIDIDSSLIVNNISHASQLVLDGLGISLLPDYLMATALAHGEVVKLFNTLQIPPAAMHVIYSDKKYLAPKIRVMVDFLCEVFS